MFQNGTSLSPTDHDEMTTTNGRFQRITPFLWFDENAHEAVNFYVSVFENSRVVATTYYGKESALAGGRKEGSVMTIAFELDGQKFTALNGGPHYKFNESISLVVHCQDQSEVDSYWEKLSRGGDEQAQQCGWLKDRFGVSWQIVPTVLPQLLAQPDGDKARKTMQALLGMRKIDVSVLESAAAAA